VTCFPIQATTRSASAWVRYSRFQRCLSSSPSKGFSNNAIIFFPRYSFKNLAELCPAKRGKFDLHRSGGCTETHAEGMSKARVSNSPVAKSRPLIMRHLQLFETERSASRPQAELRRFTLARHLNKPHTEAARRSIRPAYHWGKVATLPITSLIFANHYYSLTAKDIGLRFSLGARRPRSAAARPWCDLDPYAKRRQVCKECPTQLISRPPYPYARTEIGDFSIRSARSPSKKLKKERRVWAHSSSAFHALSGFPSGVCNSSLTCGTRDAIPRIACSILV
jgi:hypothetical protein